MSVLHKIAYLQNRRDEVPNQELARELAESENVTGIKEVADNLWIRYELTLPKTQPMICGKYTKKYGILF